MLASHRMMNIISLGKKKYDGKARHRHNSDKNNFNAPFGFYIFSSLFVSVYILHFLTNMSMGTVNSSRKKRWRGCSESGNDKIPKEL